MGTYLDTSILISYTMKDSRKNDATHIIEHVLINEDFFISHFTLIEFFAFLSRNADKYTIPPGLERLNPSKSARIRIAWEYTIRSLNLILCDDENTIKDINMGLNSKIYGIFYDCIQLAPRIELPTGDLIHTTYAHKLKIQGMVDKIASLDNHFKSKEGEIRVFTGLTLIHSDS